MDGGEQVTALAQTLSIALLVMLESLSRNERAAFVLREAFDMNHDDIAECLGAKPATCRQWLKRARDGLRDLDWHGREARADKHLLERFVGAVYIVRNPDKLAAIRATHGNYGPLPGSGRT